MVKPCRKCGSVDRKKSGRCRPCSQAYDRSYREENTEKVKEATKRWGKANPDRVIEKTRRWREANPDKVREGNRKRSARWFANNPEKANEKNRQWKKENADKVRSMSNARRARVANANGNFTAYEWRELCKQYNNRCCFPGCENTDLQPDHVIPLAKGGDNSISNIQPLCSYHNYSKGVKTNDYRCKPGFFRWLQRKLF
jgi:hypothetical protein